MSQRSEFRTSIKKVLSAIKEKNHELAIYYFKSAQSIIDRMTSKGIIHKNKASRHKSRLNLKIIAI